MFRYLLRVRRVNGLMIKASDLSLTHLLLLWVLARGHAPRLLLLLLVSCLRFII